jgi:hypothetical protein
LRGESGARRLATVERLEDQMRRNCFAVLVAGAALMAPATASAAPGDRASGGGVAIGGDITFAFNARGTGATSATGTMTEVFRGAGGGVIHADVVCLSVAGNEADIQGTITRSSVATQPVGSTLYFEVSDNGEPGAPADEFASFFSPGGVVPPNCGTPFPDTPIEHGNIQVRSG